MSRSVHTSRAKFRKAFRFDYSSDEERTRVLGKIIDEVGLKRAMKANEREKKKSEKAGIKPTRVFSELRAAASKKTPPTDEARELVQRHNQKGYG
jgi:hypothetical protein